MILACTGSHLHKVSRFGLTLSDSALTPLEARCGITLRRCVCKLAIVGARYLRVPTYDQVVGDPTAQIRLGLCEEHGEISEGQGCLRSGLPSLPHPITSRYTISHRSPCLQVSESGSWARNADSTLLSSSQALGAVPHLLRRLDSLYITFSARLPQPMSQQ